MTPLPSNNTAVLFVDYATSGEQHTMQLRYGESSTAVDAMTVLNDFLTALEPSFTTIEINGARNRAEGSTITLPLAWTGDPSFGGPPGVHSQSAWYLDFIGRSIAGKRVRLTVFGCKQMEDAGENDYRVPASGNVLDAIEVLRAASDVLVAIDGEEIIWYDYANIGVNAYWRNHIR